MCVDKLSLFYGQTCCAHCAVKFACLPSKTIRVDSSFNNCLCALYCNRHFLNDVWVCERVTSLSFTISGAERIPRIAANPQNGQNKICRIERSIGTNKSYLERQRNSGASNWQHVCSGYCQASGFIHHWCWNGILCGKGLFCLVDFSNFNFTFRRMYDGLDCSTVDSMPLKYFTVLLLVSTFHYAHCPCI